MQWPDVAVVMPVLNEENYLAASVLAILSQDYPGQVQVVLALGPSTDKTDEVAERICAGDARVSSVPNPTGRTPEGLNAALAVTTQEIVVRVDAHSELSDGYIRTAVETLQRTGADNVGGIMGARGVTSFEKAVAAAMTSPLGVGSASFHTGGSEGPTETVYLGVFKRSALERVGGYDPAFARAQDWEMNHRIRETGGTVWFNPDLFVTYRPRASVRKLAKQYFEYGSWRHEVMRRHPETRTRKSALRYYAPPLAVLLIVLGKMIGTIGFVMGNALIWGYVLPIGYVALTLISSITLVKRARSGALWLPIVLATMQMSWGIGFLTSRSKAL
ncbi:MAG: glycosyltransferase family 2 protein [Actinobacteria bacterium]|nr:glycosyltransferase family 2 protein [Actinomycetota bacterium]